MPMTAGCRRSDRAHGPHGHRSEPSGPHTEGLDARGDTREHTGRDDECDFSGCGHVPEEFGHKFFSDDLAVLGA